MATTDRMEDTPPIRRLLQNARHHLEAQLKRTIPHTAYSKGKSVSKASAFGEIVPRIRMLGKKTADRPSLDILGLELILIIFNMLYEDHPRSMGNLALVNSYYHYLARYCQHRNVTFVIESPHEKSFHDRLAYIEKHSLIPAIRSIKVHAPATEEDEECLDALVQLMQKAAGLRDLEWQNTTLYTPSNWNQSSSLPLVMSVGIPEKVVLALQPGGSVRFHASIISFDRVVDPIPDARIPVYTAPLLKRSNSLHSLSMVFTYSDEESCIEFVQIAKQILLSSPNVRKLCIDFGPQGDGPVSFPLPASYTGLGFVDGERPPALESLELIRYEFGYKKEVEPGYISGSHVGYPGDGNESDYWAEVFDWSRLKRLTIRNVDFALKIAPKLISIQHVAFDRPWGTEKVVDFYQSVPNALQSVIIPRFSALGLDGITRHGAQLRVLEIHQKETMTWADETINASSLLTIQRECPLIEELALDISRNGDWPYDVLEVLAGFPKLRILTIWFEMGRVGREPDDIVQPLVTYPAVDELYRHICLIRPRTLPALSTLKVHCGGGNEISGRSLPGLAWVEINRSGFVCQLLERGDQASDLVFDITCPALSDKDNLVLSQTRKPQKLGRFTRKSRPHVRLMTDVELAMLGPPRVGAGLQVALNCTRILQRWDLPDRLWQSAAEPTSLVVHRYSGRTLAIEPDFHKHIRKKYSAPFIDVHRVDLQLARYDKAKELGFQFKLGDRVKDIDFGIPEVSTEARAKYTGDLIVAGDGLWSKCRSKFLGSEDKPMPTGDLAYRGFLDVKDIDDPEL
ncbi:unnamed protein product [Clonostachys byssicola]|uniref:F-box domain-containing protein n=1 Tax=Clonostachys byssicola TaxID=160290 RepID=A0A9N9XWD1_9HYPO|nr:unnamed protein product [Clonostachys byssicola]